MAPLWSEFDYVPSTWPGVRAPSMILADGSALFDHFGTGLTLVDFIGKAGPLVEAAQERGSPIKHLHLAEAKVRDVWERDLFLVRPDQHVAWRGNQMPPSTEWQDVLDLICGQPKRVPDKPA